MNMDDMLKSSYTSMHDAYDNERLGHAKYDCAAEMIDDAKQYDKAEPYLWCVVSHCHKCGSSDDAASTSPDCPTYGVELYSNHTCMSAVYNYLGYVSRKKSSPDYNKSDEYYQHSIQLWSSNCGALAYVSTPITTHTQPSAVLSGS